MRQYGCGERESIWKCVNFKLKQIDPQKCPHCIIQFAAREFASINCSLKLSKPQWWREQLFSFFVYCVLELCINYLNDE